MKVPWVGIRILPAILIKHFMGRGFVRRADRFKAAWIQTPSPFQHLTHVLTHQRIVRPPEVPPFFGGAVGYLSYDLVRQFERLPCLRRGRSCLPDLEFAFFDLVAAIDHELNRLVLMFCPPLERFLGEPREKLFREGTDRLAELRSSIDQV